MNRKLTLLSSSAGWYGRHSEYCERLFESLSAITPVTVMRPPKHPVMRAVGKAYAVLKGFPPRDQRLTVVEARAKNVVNRNPSGIVHIANLESHLDILRHWDSAPKNLIATIHFPPSIWRPGSLELLRKLNSAIILYDRDVSFFEGYVGQGRVRTVRHGVDLDFFRPAKSRPSGPARVLFCGQFLRDFEMLARVVNEVQDAGSDIEFDLVIPAHARQSPGLAGIADRGKVRWYSGLTDEELLGVYQGSSVAIFPLLDTAANNAIVECLACGVPIIATDVGGIRDYGGGSLYPVVPAGDSSAMVAELKALLADHTRWDGVSSAQRAYAEGSLSWEMTAQQHLEAYEALM